MKAAYLEIPNDKPLGQINLTAARLFIFSVKPSTLYILVSI